MKKMATLLLSLWAAGVTHTSQPRRPGQIVSEREMMQKMKIRTHRYTLVLFITIIFVSVCRGDYRIIGGAINGGSRTSTGGQYVLTGTISQPDAGYSEGKQYEVLGGFSPGEPLCLVDFKHFARFADLWYYQGDGLPADLDGNGYVNLYDLELFADMWLCSCPYDWPLR